MRGWNESWGDNSWRGEPKALKNESWVDQSWELNAPKKQASSRTNRSTSYMKEDTYNNGTYDDGTYDDGTNEDDSYDMQDWSDWSPPPRYH